MNNLYSFCFVMATVLGYLIMGRERIRASHGSPGRLRDFSSRDLHDLRWVAKRLERDEPLSAGVRQEIARRLQEILKSAEDGAFEDDE